MARTVPGLGDLEIETLEGDLKRLPEPEWYFDSHPDNVAVLQGDLIVAPLSVPSESSFEVQDGPVMVLSHSCDIDKEKSGWAGAFVSAVPLMSVDAVGELWCKLKEKDVAAWNSRLESIKLNQVTNMLYIPESERFTESIADFSLAAPIDVGVAKDCAEVCVQGLSARAGRVFLLRIAHHFTHSELYLD